MKMCDFRIFLKRKCKALDVSKKNLQIYNIFNPSKRPKRPRFSKPFYKTPFLEIVLEFLDVLDVWTPHIFPLFSYNFVNKLKKLKIKQKTFINIIRL
jgi:hypothetical protein